MPHLLVKIQSLQNSEYSFIRLVNFQLVQYNINNQCHENGSPQHSRDG